MLKHPTRGCFFITKGSDTMAEKSYFYDSTASDERIYQAADFARFHHQIIGDGVSNTLNLPDLEVSAENNMEVSLGAGYMFANGYLYENSSTMTLKHDIADSSNDRIDRIVIRFDSDPAQRRIYAVIKKGTPAKNPAPPSITRDNYVHEMSVAQVRIIAGKSHIEQSEITDERANDDVCGYIPLHNIYRGLGINELGMVTMPNQSFLEVENSNPNAVIDGEERTDILLGNQVVEDTQNELHNGMFVPKADGIYTIWAMVRCDEADLRGEDVGGTDIQIFLVVNDEQTRFPIIVNVLHDHRDNMWTGSTVMRIKKGDKVHLSAKLIHKPGGDIPIRNTWFRISKNA